MKAVIYKDGSGRRQCWRFRIVAGNNEIVEASEPYFSRWNCKRAIRKRYPGIPIEGEKPYRKYP